MIAYKESWTIAACKKSEEAKLLLKSGRQGRFYRFSGRTKPWTGSDETIEEPSREGGI